MGILDGLFGNSPAPATAAPAPASPSPDYATFLQRLIAAKAAAARAHPTSLWNAISGAGTDEATAGAQADAPAAWDQFKQAQAASQGAQLGNTANIAAQGAMANTDIDPNNIAASQGAIQKSLGGVFNDQSGTASADPLAQRRAFYDRMGNMLLRMPGGAAMAKDIFALRDKNIPDGTQVGPGGIVRDVVSSQPVTGSFGDVKAAQAQPTKVMETNLDMRKAGNQAALDRTTHAVNANVDSAHTLVNGLDPVTGLPVTRTQADVLASGGKNIVNNNPYFEGQQTELKDLRAKSQSADQGLDLAQQIHNAANGVLTGKGADALQNVRKLALTAGNLVGADPNLKLADNASKFEQLKFASQQLVAVASHNLSPRVAMNIYNQISAVKPGDQTSIQGLRDIIKKQIVPALQRDQALYKGTNSYYQKNPFKSDAAAVVPGQLPLEQFGVRDIHGAQPGDFYTDPTTGNLRQRPLQ